MITKKTNIQGTQWWINENGAYHREDGPAIIWHDGDKSWIINGEYHREDGPALEWKSGHQWWYRNKKIECKSQEEFEQKLKMKAFW